MLICHVPGYLDGLHSDLDGDQVHEVLVFNLQSLYEDRIRDDFYPSIFGFSIKCWLLAAILDVILLVNFAAFCKCYIGNVSSLYDAYCRLCVEWFI